MSVANISGLVSLVRGYFAPSVVKGGADYKSIHGVECELIKSFEGPTEILKAFLTSSSEEVDFQMFLIGKIDSSQNGMVIIVWGSVAPKQPRDIPEIEKSYVDGVEIWMEKIAAENTTLNTITD